MPVLLSAPRPSTTLPVYTGRSLGACGRIGLGGPFRPQPLLLCSRNPSSTMLQTHTLRLPHRLCVSRWCLCLRGASHVVKRIPHKHLARLNAVGWSDNTIFLHHFNHACCPIIAYTQAALQHGNRRLANFGHQCDGLIVFFVILLVLNTHTLSAWRQKTLVIAGLLHHFPCLYQAADFRF